MADGAVPPGSLDRRYEAVVGGESEELLYTLVRKHLNFSRIAWEQLAWYDQQMYLSGLEQMELIKTAESPADSDSGGEDPLADALSGANWR